MPSRLASPQPSSLASPPPSRRRRRSHLFRPLLFLVAATISAALLLLRHSPSDVDSHPDPTLHVSLLDAGELPSNSNLATEVGSVADDNGDGDDLFESDVAGLAARMDHAGSLHSDMAPKLGHSDALETDVIKRMSHVDRLDDDVAAADGPTSGRCATVEEMGSDFRTSNKDNNSGNSWEKESLRVREIIRRHFEIHGADRVRGLSPRQFCRQGFVLGKASEAGFGNEMYKILTAAALSVMLKRTLIIGQTRGLYPFGDYISYSNVSFTLREVKHLWRRNDCASGHGKKLVIRVDNFEQPSATNVLCSDWRTWKHSIIWFQGTTDAVAIQFFLKNIHPGMRNVASLLFGKPNSVQSRPNVFGELMRVIISPTRAVKEAVDWVLKGADPDLSLHMRMLTNRPKRAVQAAVTCIKRALSTYRGQTRRPRVAVVSDTPSFIQDIMPSLVQFADVLHFDYRSYDGNISGGNSRKQEDFRSRDWGPAPRWVAFVDFFLASRAKHAVVSGAHRRVGTTYAQLIAASAAANQIGENSNSSGFSFFSSFHSNILVNGLRSQVGWGHAWSRFAGPLSCGNQPHQCALTPLLPPGWWDGEWQSPSARDVRRLQLYGVRLTNSGEVTESSLQTYCRSRKDHVKTFPVFGQCKDTKCA